MSAVLDPDLIADAYAEQVGRAALADYRERLVEMRLDRQRISAMLAIAEKEIVAALPLMESPIERDLLPWLVVGGFRSVRVSPLPVVRPDRDWRTLSIYSAVLWPQFEISRFRLDFALCLRRHGRPVVVAIECDGAQFHDAAQDAMRDAALRAAGILTVRASGAEIRRSPSAVIGRIDDALITSSAGEQP